MSIHDLIILIVLLSGWKRVNVDNACHEKSGKGPFSLSDHEAKIQSMCSCAEAHDPAYLLDSTLQKLPIKRRYMRGSSSGP